MLRVTTLRKPTCLSPLDQNIAGNESVNAMTTHTISQCDFCVRSVRINIEICVWGGGGGLFLQALLHCPESALEQIFDRRTILDFKVLVQNNFVERFFDCIAKITLMTSTFERIL